jgi:hypothetical protein
LKEELKEVPKETPYFPTSILRYFEKLFLYYKKRLPELLDLLPMGERRL